MPTVRCLRRDEQRAVWAARLERPYRFESPFGGEEFALLLLVADPEVAADEQAALSAAFVAQGCRYACATGHGCSSWDDSIDWAYLDACDYEPDDEGLVMTTWHADEPLREVARFFLRQTSFPLHDDGDERWVPARFLALAVGGGPDDLARLEAAVRAELEAEG